jgi:hypothetical protein
MIERGEDAPFGTKARDRRLVRESPAHDLDRHLLLERGIGPGGEVDDAHPTLTEFPDDLV